MFLEEFQQAIEAADRARWASHVDYVPQVIAEFFRRAVDPPLDGIVFASAHNDHSNCVIFATADNVGRRRLQRNDGTDPTHSASCRHSRLCRGSTLRASCSDVLLHRVDYEPVGDFDGSQWQVSDGNRWKLS